MKFITIPVVVMMGLSVVACKKEEPQQTTNAQVTATPTPSPIPTPKREYPESPMPLKVGGSIQILEEGSGDKPAADQRVFFYYDIVTLDGDKLDSLSLPDDPISFVMGEGAVVPEWEEAMTYLRIGSKAEIVFSPESAMVDLLEKAPNNQQVIMQLTRVDDPLETSSNETDRDVVPE